MFYMFHKHIVFKKSTGKDFLDIFEMICKKLHTSSICTSPSPTIFVQYTSYSLPEPKTGYRYENQFGNWFRRFCEYQYFCYEDTSYCVHIPLYMLPKYLLLCTCSSVHTFYCVHIHAYTLSTYFLLEYIFLCTYFLFCTYSHISYILPTVYIFLCTYFLLCTYSHISYILPTVYIFLCTYFLLCTYSSVHTSYILHTL